MAEKPLVKNKEKGNLLVKIIKIVFFIWVFSVLVVLITIGLVVLVRGETFDKTPEIFSYTFLVFFFLGFLAFLVGILVLTINLLTSGLNKKQNIFIFPIKLFFALFFLPFYLTFYIVPLLKIIKALKNSGVKNFFKKLSLSLLFKKAAYLIFVWLIILPVWLAGYFSLFYIAEEYMGYNPKLIPIAGTGSMYPTFPKGKGKDPKELAKQIVSSPGMIRYPNGIVVFGKRIFNYEIGRGDIVVVENEKIRKITKEINGEPTGWVKRVIGLPGDTIELKGGIVYLNNESLKEPYTARPRSTFGQTFLSECKKITVPQNHIFVMGDNRKASGDSREIGFIEKSAVYYILPLKEQKGDLVKYWRKTDKDFDDSAKIKLDKEKYLILLNEKRKEFKARPLKYQKKLELSAQKRGEVILKFNDFSFEATRSGYTMEKAMYNSGYSNIVWGEVPIQGYFEAEELIENQFQFPESKKFLTDKQFQEIGIAEVEGEINNCPTQVVVLHLAGYVPPNYSKEVVESWKKLLENLKEIQPGWADLKNYESFYQRNKNDIDRINEIINQRISNVSQIVSRMEANQWLTAQEKKYIEIDESLSNEQEEIAKKLNSQN
ncbi:MAG: signal peptidase I [Microgenomates group bacterium]|nr:signal peptidase I [Microgenomates group bacterium]